MLTCPPTQFSQVGEFASSKSAIQHCAPELSALIAIFRSTGPVISVRRSIRSGGVGATRQSPSRTARVSGRKSGSRPASNSRCRSRRRTSSSSRRGAKRSVRSATKAQASGVRMDS